MTISIPHVSDEELEKRYAKVKPLVVHDPDSTANDDTWGSLWTIEKPNFRAVSYIWDPKRLKQAGKVKAVTTIQTYHSYGAPVLFKPSVAEVLSQIPEKYFDGSVDAFYISKAPQSADDLNKYKAALDEGYHVAAVTLVKFI